MYYNVYDVHENRNTKSFFGYELVVDGERGRDTFPGKWDLAEAKRHYMQGLPWSEPLKNAHTYIIHLSGNFYALAADTFMTTVYAIGPDRRGLNDAEYFTGSIKERNAAIRSVCMPHDYKTARRIAEENGIYSGQLYSYETEA